jgi:hypothetical protein
MSLLDEHANEARWPQDTPHVNWTLSEGKLYAQISDFGKGVPTCGKCRNKLPKGIAHKDGENEIIYWECHCQCGQICVLYND